MEGIKDVQVEESEHGDHEVEAVVDEDSILDEEVDVVHQVFEASVPIAKNFLTVVNLELRSLRPFSHENCMSHLNAHLSNV